MLLIHYCRVSDGLVAVRIGSADTVFAEWQMPARLWRLLAGQLSAGYSRRQVRVSEMPLEQW